MCREWLRPTYGPRFSEKQSVATPVVAAPGADLPIEPSQQTSGTRMQAQAPQRTAVRVVSAGTVPRAFCSVRCAAGPARRSHSRTARSGGAGAGRPLTVSGPAASPATQPAPRSSAVCASVANGKLISSTEVPAFIPRDDMMDQMYRWTLMEGGESGQRNFGMPMKIEPVYYDDKLWGFNVAIYKEGNKLTDIGVMFDKQNVTKHEWVGRGEDGFPVMEGKSNDVMGKNFEIWCVKAASAAAARINLCAAWRRALQHKAGR